MTKREKNILFEAAYKANKEFEKASEFYRHDNIIAAKDMIDILDLKDYTIGTKLNAAIAIGTLVQDFGLHDEYINFMVDKELGQEVRDNK